MTTPEIGQLREFLARSARRLTLVATARGAAIGFAVAVCFAIANTIAHHAWRPPAIASIGLAVMGALAGLIRALANRPQIAAIVERRAPECRNLLITASELIEEESGTNAYVSTLVFANAARMARSLRLRRLFPLRNEIVALVACVTLWVAAVSRPAAPIAARGAGVLPADAALIITGVDVEVISPAYLGGGTRLLHDPARVEAPVGSRLRLAVRATGNAVTMETAEQATLISASTGQTFHGEFLAGADGYVTLEPTSDGRRGPRRLIGISTIPDHAPSVRITAPARDLKFANGRQTITLAIAATDDNALASLRLRYTRVAGSGERYTFTDGELPLTITRTDARTWTALAHWNIDSLALGPGDMLVYRAVATDHRPGSPASESDSYIAEVLAPGGIAAAGFAVDPEVERYALSEQMVILKTERLLARKPAMAADSFADGAAELAAEQRRVRAEYVFMMGGEVGGADDAGGDINEEAEAAGEGDLAVQRMLNEGRAALLSAIRAMSRAATALTGNDLPAALVQERIALAQLERGFSHTKIILRALTEREQLDMTRRLGGTLTDAVRDLRPAGVPDANPRLAALRQALSGIAVLSGRTDPGSDDARTATTLAGRLLRIDPSSRPVQQIAAQLDSTASAIVGGHRDAARVHLGNAAIGITAVMREGMEQAPVGHDGETARLKGAFTDALRRRGTP